MAALRVAVVQRGRRKDIAKRGTEGENDEMREKEGKGGREAEKGGERRGRSRDPAPVEGKERRAEGGREGAREGGNHKRQRVVGGRWVVGGPEVDG